MNLEIDNETRAMVMLVRSMGKEYLRPLGLESDRTGKAIPKDHPFYQTIAETGYMSHTLPRNETKKNTVGNSQKTTQIISGSYVRTVLVSEEGSYWDRGALISLPGPGLGGPPVQTMGTWAQQQRFFAVFRQKLQPAWAAFAMTEPQAGSDVARIETTATKDGDEWILNGQKMYSSNSSRAEWVVVFATVDKNLGRSGHRAFIVEKSTPGFEILKIEEKMGIKAYETASFALNNCRVPEANLLGGEEYYNRESSGGFGGAMKTFNATRPIVASMAVGIARAAFDVANNFVNTEYPKHSFQRLDRIKGMLSEMQQHIIFARLMCLKAAWLMDNHKSNSLEASQAKLFAPSLCLKVTNLAREILAEAGIDRDYLVEKFARDVKAIDIVEGTKQIQNLVVSRHLFGRQFL